MTAATATAAELYCPTCERNYPSGERCPNDNTRLVRIATSSDALIGRQLDDRYTVLARIGAGGMGTVYRATQHAVGRDVAIKVVSPRLVSDPSAIKRFLREAKVTSRLSHPNIVSVIDFGQTTDGLFYLVTELLAGRTLDEVINDEGRMSAERVVRIGAQICDALEGAHAAHVVHRDLKPHNVMLLDTSRDLVKVLDFGLVKSLTAAPGMTNMTQEGALLGTPAYMPPEVIAGLEVDERADLYSLGCVLFMTATGNPPYQGSSAHDVIAMHAMEPVPRAEHVPSALAAVIERLMAKNPQERYFSARAARHALEAAIAAGNVEELVPTLLAEPEPPKSTLIGWSGVTAAPSQAAPGVVRAPAEIATVPDKARPAGFAPGTTAPSTAAETMVVQRRFAMLPLVLGGAAILAIGVVVGVIALRATAPTADQPLAPPATTPSPPAGPATAPSPPATAPSPPTTAPSPPATAPSPRVGPAIAPSPPATAPSPPATAPSPRVGPATAPSPQMGPATAPSRPIPVQPQIVKPLTKKPPQPPPTPTTVESPGID